MMPKAIAVSLALWVAAAGPCLAQTATLSGRVTNPADAVVGGARVTIVNTDTGDARELASANDGYYSAPYLPPGHYRLEVSHDDFRSVTIAGIELTVDARSRIDVVLPVSGPNETIQVIPAAADPDRESSAVAYVIDRGLMSEMPLNGRNLTTLVLLSPGTVEGTPSSPRDAVHVNGARAFQNSVLVDGVDNNTYTFGRVNSTEVLPLPLDAVEQVRVAGATYGAEYGRAAGGIINVVLRSGSNTYHGSAFEFLRTDRLESAEYFARRAGLERQPLRYDQFGATTGGWIIRDRLFFFGSYQGIRNRSTVTETTTVPSADERAGRFGARPIYDPTSVVGGVRQQFPGNVIPPNRIDPVGLRFAGLYPNPNRPGVIDNFVAPVGTLDLQHRIDGRLDGQLGSRVHAYLRGSWMRGRETSDALFPPPGNGTGDPARGRTRASSMAFGATHVFSNSVVNETHGGYTFNRHRDEGFADEPLAAAFGLHGIPSTAGVTGLPRMFVNGFATLGEFFTDLGPWTRVAQVTDQLSFTRGAHLVRLGGEFWVRTNVADNANAAGGALTFNGQFTANSLGRGGSALADLLLGQTNTAVLSTPLTGEFHQRYAATYVSDTWRPTSSLTFDLGLRYEFQTPTWERDNRMSNFELDPTDLSYGALVPARPGALQSRTFITPDRNNFAPRIGVAYQWRPSTLVRGGFGIFYAGPGYQAAPYTPGANPPNFVRAQILSPFDATRSSLILADGFPEGTLNPANLASASLIALPLAFPVGSARECSLQIERQLPAAITAALAYVGSASRNLLGFNAANAAPPGPGPIQRRRPFPSAGNITEVGPIAQASYHALQLHVDRRFAESFGLSASYTWSHAIDNSTDFSEAGGVGTLLVPQDPRNLAAEKASASFDVRHRLAAAAVYGPGEPRWAASSSLLRAIVDGWQVSTVFVVESGLPMTPQLARNPANTTTPERPDCVGDGNLPRGQRTVDRWFDVNAFAVPDAYTYGNCGRNTLRAPGSVNLDVGLARVVRMAGVRVQLRADIFNVANAAHFAQPNLFIDLPEAAGRITATSRPPRQAQLGIRLTF
jgi:hypothetical protein